MSTISVIIPAYNTEKFIGEAIESALNQTRPAAEVIVVDDASKDGTAQIARSFGDRVTVLANERNSGPGHSRNVGVEHSTGEFLAFLDAVIMSEKWPRADAPPLRPASPPSAGEMDCTLDAPRLMCVDV